MKMKLKNIFSFIKNAQAIPGLSLVILLLANCYYAKWSFVPALVILALLVIYYREKLFSFRQIFLFLIPFLFVVLIGLMSSLITNSGNATADYFRDIFYLSQNAIFIIAGILLGKILLKNKKLFCLYFILAGLIIVAVNTVSAMGSSLDKMDSIRSSMMKGMEIILICCFISLFFVINKNKLVIRIVAAISFLIFLVAFIFSFSRTGIILLVVLVLAYAYLTDQMAGSIVGMVLIVGMSAVFLIGLKVEIPLLNTFIKKLSSSFREISINHDWNISEYRTIYWRGFESYTGLQSYKAGNAFTFVFGRGFGSVARLSYAQPLGDRIYIDLPILHNSYLAILIKFGAVGLLGIILSFVLPFISILKKQNDTINSKILALSLVLYLIISPLVDTSILSACTLGSVLTIYGIMLSFEDEMPKIEWKFKKKGKKHGEEAVAVQD